jgi:hypothetical protein
MKRPSPLRLRASAVPRFSSWVEGEQSGVALRFPPHSKVSVRGPRFWEPNDEGG